MSHLWAKRFDITKVCKCNQPNTNMFQEFLSQYIQALELGLS